jgi:hypothetical protein
VTWRAFLAGCWFGHSEVIWDGSAHKCTHCWSVIPVLPSATITGPAHQPAVVRGQPRIKATVTRPDNVRKFERRESER